jgi:hypothetical protein
MFTVISAGASPRLSSTTARSPSRDRTLLYTSVSPVDAIRTPWMARGSWSTAMISGFFSVSIIDCGSVRGSDPMISGELITAHMTSWVVDSSSFSS